MSLDRLELFHSFRFGHSSFGRTLVQEVERLRPGIRYVWKDGELSEERYLSFAYREDRCITFDESVERVKGFFADVMHGTLTHPATGASAHPSASYRRPRLAPHFG